MSRVLATMCAAWLATACAGTREGVATELWPPPQGPRPLVSELPADHPVREMVTAFESGACERGVALSRALMADVEGRVAEAFHRADGAGEGTGRSLAAAAMRALLDDYVYAQPALLVIGEHRFRFPDWWVDDFTYCLTALGRYEDAAEVFVIRLQDELEADALWHLALAYAWDERRSEAIDVLEAWPEGLEAPGALPAVLARLREGQPVPRRLEAGERE